MAHKAPCTGPTGPPWFDQLHSPTDFYGPYRGPASCANVEQASEYKREAEEYCVNPEAPRARLRAFNTVAC